MGDCSAYALVPEALQFWEDNLFGECSTRGECVTGVCVCDALWTGRSDFVNTEGLDCQVSEIGVKVLWGVHLAFTLVCTFLVRKEVRAKWEQHQSIKRKKTEQGGSFSIRENRGMMAIFSFLFITLPCSIAIGVIKMTMPEQRVGLTWIVTVLFALNKFGFYMCAYFFQPALLSTILRGQRNVKNLVVLSDTMAWWNMILSSVLGLLPIVTVVASDGTDRVARIIYICYFAGSMVSMFSFGAQAFYIKRKVVSVLQKSFDMTKSNHILEIRSRLVQFQVGIMRQASVQFLVYGSFLILPFLWNKHDYFLPISWLAMPLLYMKLARSTVSTKRVGATSETGSAASKSSKNSKTDDRSFNMQASSFNQNSDLKTQALSSYQSVHVQSFMEKAASMIEDPVVSFHNSDSDDEYV